MEISARRLTDTSLPQIGIYIPPIHESGEYGITSRMARNKTSIFIEKALFEQGEALAHKLKVSRSRLYTLALEAYIARHDNRQLLVKLNTAFRDAPISHDSHEQKRFALMRKQHRKQIEGEW